MCNQHNAFIKQQTEGGDWYLESKPGGGTNTDSEHLCTEQPQLYPTRETDTSGPSPLFFLRSLLALYFYTQHHLLPCCLLGLQQVCLLSLWHKIRRVTGMVPRADVIIRCVTECVESEHCFQFLCSHFETLQLVCHMWLLQK